MISVEKKKCSCCHYHFESHIPSIILIYSRLIARTIFSSRKQVSANATLHRLLKTLLFNPRPRTIQHLFSSSPADTIPLINNSGQHYPSHQRIWSTWFISPTPLAKTISMSSGGGRIGEEMKEGLTNEGLMREGVAKDGQLNGLPWR